MEQSSCTEDRIHHALQRCLYGLGPHSPNKELWNAGLCINRWCLEELVKRNPDNFLILLQQIVRKTREVLELCQYDLLVPLTLLFTSTLLKTPYLDPACGLLLEAYLLFHRFLAWPEPCSTACRWLLCVVYQELRAPGISFQKLVREEQALAASSHSSKTMTVLLVSPEEDLPPEFLSVSQQLSSSRRSQTDVTVRLISHAVQAALGAQSSLPALRTALQSKSPEELEQLLAAVTETLETAAATADPGAAREGLRRGMEELRESLGAGPPADGTAGPGGVETFALPFAKCHMYHWEKDNFDNLMDLLAGELARDPPDPARDPPDPARDPPDPAAGNGTDDDNNNNNGEPKERASPPSAEQTFPNHRISTASTCSRDSAFSCHSASSSGRRSVPPALSESSGVDSDFSEDGAAAEEEEEVGGDDGQHRRRRRKPRKKSSSILGVERFSLLFRSHRSPALCRRAKSVGFRGDVIRDCPVTGLLLKRPEEEALALALAPAPVPAPTERHVCLRRRPILSSGEGDAPRAATLVRVVVFGGDREAGRLARAYSDLQRRESARPRLTRVCRLQFYLVPARRRGGPGSPGSGGHAPTEGQTGSPLKGTLSAESNGAVLEDNTTDIAQLIGMSDPWYERSVLSLLSLSSDVLCQTTCRVDADAFDSVERLPLLADQVLYYCRLADQPILVQLYQVELTLAGGERRMEVFIHSLELGHTAGTRAVRAMGAAGKRFGIDGDREAVPLPLGVGYNKVSVSGRSQWCQTEIVCTSIHLCKSCKKPEQLDHRMESLQLTMTEVLKRQSSKAKKSYNQQISVSEVKVNKVLVNGAEDGTTFAVCLDQDEKKIIQSVTRCEVSLCCKPGSSSDWRSYKPSPGQIQPLHPSYCSLLCLPVTSFSGSYH